jgi:hypothetical protein
MLAAHEQQQASLRIEQNVQVAETVQIAFDSLIEMLGPRLPICTTGTQCRSYLNLGREVADFQASRGWISRRKLAIRATVAL